MKKSNTPQSDTDYKGLFLPSKESCYLNKQPKHISYTSGSDYSKNSANDIDFEMWSLQYWLKLLEKGDTNSIDLLYSASHPKMIEYVHPIMSTFLSQPYKLFDIDKCNGYSGYIRGQVKKYGIKGERVGVFKELSEFMNKYISENLNIDIKLNILINYIIDNHYDKSYCFDKEINGERCLVVCGKVHMGSITVKEFNERIQREYKKFGERARLANLNRGIDWKACSHAMRAVYQMEELIHNGKIKFPLDKASIILKIKEGILDWKYVSDLIYNGLNRIDDLMADLSDHPCKRDNDFINNSIVKLYYR